MISVVLRARNEAAWIGRCLTAIRRQRLPHIDVILVDNDSTDGTVEVAAAHGATLTNISREEFSYGRALNLGIEAARQAAMPGVPWQHCQFHTIQNPIAHVPKSSMRTEVVENIRRVVNTEDAAEANRRFKDTVARYQKSAPGLASWLEDNIPEALTTFAFPVAHRRRLRSSNQLERRNEGD